MASSRPRRTAAATGMDRRLMHDLADLAAALPDYVLQTDRAGAITYLNPSARAALGLPAGGALGPLHLADLVSADTARRFAHEMVPAAEAHGRWQGESTLHLGALRDLPFNHLVVAHPGADAAHRRFSSVMRPLAADQAVQRQQQRQTDVLRAMAEAIPATVVVVDREGRYRFVNAAFERYCGLPAERILGRQAHEVMGADEIARRRPYMQRALGGEAVDFTLDYPSAEGTRWLALSCVPLKLEGRVDGFVGISQDITAQRREQARLQRLAERDPLTGLLNRAGFERRLQARRHGGEPGALALLYIDLDHFKPVNDRHGHPAGDELLRQFAQRLGQVARRADLVARLGGDEFAVLLWDLQSPDNAHRVADQVLRAADAPFHLPGGPVQVSASVGVAFAAAGSLQWDALVARADALLYQAKADGRGRLASEQAA